VTLRLFMAMLVPGLVAAAAEPTTIADPARDDAPRIRANSGVNAISHPGCPLSSSQVRNIVSAVLDDRGQALARSGQRMEVELTCYDGEPSEPPLYSLTVSFWGDVTGRPHPYRRIGVITDGSPGVQRPLDSAISRGISQIIDRHLSRPADRPG